MTDPRPVCTEKTQDIIKTLRSNAQVEAALELAVKQQEKRIADQIILTETPAPPFHEEERAKVLLGMFKQYGLTDVKQDAIGNVIGRRKGTGSGPTLVMGAHIDTVFPAGTDCKVHRADDTELVEAVAAGAFENNAEAFAADGSAQDAVNVGGVDSDHAVIVVLFFEERFAAA